MEKENTVISHIKQQDGRWIIQSNKAHQQGVAELAARFASDFGMSEWGRVLGLLHDVGKEKTAFQNHIKKESGYDTTVSVLDDSSHAFVGGLVCQQQFPKMAPMLANILMGHHRGLYDNGVWTEMLKREIPADVHPEKVDANLAIPQRQLTEQDFHHLVRMLFSCLVDADYLDTEAFMMPEQSRLRGAKATMAELLEKMEVHLDNLSKGAPDTEVNRIRRYVQQCCKEQSEGPVDYYSLTVPTGGGKTLSSVLWALRHAVKNSLNRIIIAIPYTSIIVQTAATLKAIFGEENVLEHHSNVTEDSSRDYELTRRARLSTENWDYPIIVTTNVQLFESLFSNRPSHCRKLHNIVKSVLILDEVQTLPLEFLRPIVDTFKSLKNIFGTSILFTTASQPTLEGDIEGTNYTTKFQALPDIHEIIPASAQLHDKLRRVELDINDSPQGYDDVASQIAHHDRVLCIANTRKDAKELYGRLPQEGLTLHLSRMMCPAHVRATIDTVKDALKDESQHIIRVIATQLIEAGVDIDFPVVYRQEAGLDSILQAAGRCNREGKLGICTTHVFSLASEHSLPPGLMSQANSARLNMGTGYDWFSPEAMSAFFRQLFSRAATFDKAQIGSLLYKPREMQFEQAADAFRLIDDATMPVYVRWGEGAALVDRLLEDGVSYPLLKKLSHYAVNVRKRDLQKLQAAGALMPVPEMENAFILTNNALYDDRVGLVTSGEWLDEPIII